MSYRPLLPCVLVIVAIVLCGGCDPKEEKKKPGELSAETAKKKPGPPMADMGRDQAFLAFVGHLRTAVSRRDHAEIAAQFAPDFGYRWDEAPAGETVFDFWDKHNTWTEVESILSGRFVPNEQYMVAPIEFATNTNYRGYRAGMRLVNGSWKFAYFITGEDVLQ